MAFAVLLSWHSMAGKVFVVFGVAGVNHRIDNAALLYVLLFIFLPSSAVLEYSWP